ncbi:MAG: hypothetical protein E6I21_07490 [Chloroflexi bacterium]|nr:MAG: hypothetical protein E6I41_03225 [Chloroflexota bacterium]TMF17905.1 MAG: hypothetical protein E6I35_07555 [Chloroflexota bacterium]TMF50828.1 MAG: hypothetical protein E6I21_07490 [Chloroflexota bacterium]
MSQMPPPPPSQPAPMGGGSPSAVGGNKNLYTILAWALFPPIGSLIFLFVGKDDPDVKNNAAQAVVIHGGAFAVWIILRILTAIVLPIAILLVLWDLVWFVLWLIGLVLALQAGGKRVNFPVLGPMAANYVPMVEGWAK